MEEQKIKDQMHRREEPCSIEITEGTPSKGTAVKLKVYFNDKNVDDRVKLILQAREFLITKQVIS